MYIVSIQATNKRTYLTYVRNIKDHMKGLCLKLSSTHSFLLWLGNFTWAIAR